MGNFFTQSNETSNPSSDATTEQSPSPASRPPSTSPLPTSSTHPTLTQPSPPPSHPSPAVPRPSAFFVPQNQNQVLDLSPPSRTPENIAKRALLSTAPGSNSVALVGMGGAGKTTTACALGWDSEIWQRFSDGIWFIQLGHEIVLASFITKLQQLVKKAFPDFVEEFKELANDADIHANMIQELIDRLIQKRILVIFDDVWDVDSEVFGLVSDIYTACCRRNGGLFKVLSSTRDEQIARVHDISVNMNPNSSNRNRALAILCWYANVGSESVQLLSSENTAALDNIIGSCGGLPLALSVAGSCVRSMMDPSTNVWEQDVFIDYWKSVEKNIADLARRKIGKYEGLFAALRMSLEVLERKWKHEEITVRAMLISLCVLQKQMFLPVKAIEQLWGVVEVTAREGVQLLSRHSLVGIVRNEKRSIVGLEVHDLVQDFSVEMAGGEVGVAAWHGKMLDGYCSSTNRGVEERNEEAGKSEEWWEKIDDKYFADNVVRHMVGAGRATEALRLLTDYRWIQKINEDEDRAPFKKIIADMEMLNAYLENKNWETGASIMYDLNVITKTMILCISPYCTKSRKQCTFQLEGRLRALNSGSAIFKRLLWSINEHAKLPWARAGPGVLSGVEISLKRVLCLEGKTKCMAMGMREDEIVVGGRDGKLRTVGSNDGSTKLMMDGEHDGSVFDLFVNQTSGLVYSCNTDGEVIIWEENKRVNSFRVDVQMEGGIESMQVLYQQQVIIFSTYTGRLMVLDVKNGQSKSLHEHGDEVVSLAMGPSEDIFCSGSKNGVIRVWDAHTFGQFSDALSGHTGCVLCLSLNSTESLLASSSWDGSVRLWDLKGRREVWKSPTEGRGVATCVTFSRNGELLYSGHGEGEICVWRVESGGADVSLIHTMHNSAMGWLRKLLIGENGLELFALSDTGRVYVWDGSVTSRDKDTMYESSVFLPDVRRFAISADGATVATWDDRLGRIEIRNMRDVNKGIDHVVRRFQVQDAGRLYIRLMAVSNDYIVAYCSVDNWTVHVIDVNSGSQLHALSEVARSSNFSPLHLKYVNQISFRPDGKIITADSLEHVGGEEVRQKVSWCVSTGECLQVSATATDGSGNDSAIPRLSCLVDWVNSSTDVHFEDGSVDFTIASTEHIPASVLYSAPNRRLWVCRGSGGLEYIDLIHDDRTPIPQSSEPPLPILSSPILISRPPNATDENSEQVYDVFISHAGPDKRFIAELLYDALVKLGLKVFFDRRELRPGQNAGEKMNHAMKTARIAVVILSPQFAARSWTTKELLCFVERFRRDGERGVTIIPVFYRLSLDDCRKGNVLGLLDMRDENGEKIFEKEGFGELVEKNSRLISNMLEALGLLRGITGIENLEGATNGDGKAEEGKRERLVARIVEAIIEAKERRASASVAGPSG